MDRAPCRRRAGASRSVVAITVPYGASAGTVSRPLALVFWTTPEKSTAASLGTPRCRFLFGVGPISACCRIQLGEQIDGHGIENELAGTLRDLVERRRVRVHPEGALLQLLDGRYVRKVKLAQQ